MCQAVYSINASIIQHCDLKQDNAKIIVSPSKFPKGTSVLHS